MRLTLKTDANAEERCRFQPNGYWVASEQRCANRTCPGFAHNATGSLNSSLVPDRLYVLPKTGIPEGSAATLVCPYGIPSEDWHCLGGEWTGPDCSRDRADFGSVPRLRLSVSSGLQATATSQSYLGTMERAEDCFKRCLDTTNCWAVNLVKSGVVFACSGLLDLPDHVQPSANPEDILFSIAIP